MKLRHIETPTHGRYLVTDGPAERLLVGFHGFAETAESMLDQLQQIPGAEAWTLVAIQALHPFYTGSGRIVASWMTSLDRELAIDDNIRYVRSVMAAFAAPRHVVFVGFSQGVAMAFRAAAYAWPEAAGVIALGGDVPPEIRSEVVHLPPVLIGRGSSDSWYTEEKLKDDLRFLTRAETCVFEGAHEWTDEFRAAAGGFLRRLVL